MSRLGYAYAILKNAEFRITLRDRFSSTTDSLALASCNIGLVFDF
jgi:hypothetical protein